MTEHDHIEGEALTELLAHRRRFQSFVERSVPNSADAEEILQHAFVKWVEAGDAVRTGESIVAWFFRVLRNGIADYFRKRDAGLRVLERVADWVEADGEPDGDDERTVCGCMNALLPEINADYADLIRRIDLRGQSIEDVSRRKQQSANNTRVKLHRARRALRNRVMLTCGICAEHGCLDCNCHQPS